MERHIWTEEFLKNPEQVWADAVRFGIPCLAPEQVWVAVPRLVSENDYEAVAVLDRVVSIWYKEFLLWDGYKIHKFGENRYRSWLRNINYLTICFDMPMLEQLLP